MNSIIIEFLFVNRRFIEIGNVEEKGSEIPGTRTFEMPPSVDFRSKFAVMQAGTSSSSPLPTSGHNNKTLLNEL